MTIDDEEKKIGEHRNLFGTTEFQIKIGEEGIFQQVVKSNYSGSKKESIKVKE